MEEKTYYISMNFEDIKVLSDACRLLTGANTGRGHAVVNYLPIDDKDKYRLGIELNKHIATVLPGGVDGYTSTLPFGHPSNPFSDRIEKLSELFRRIIDDHDNQTTE